MNDHGLTKENLAGTLPPALRSDPSVVALSEALAELLAARPAEIDRLLIYPAIDTLDEPLLDILARDFKVDWWDPEYSLEEKRRTLKDSWRVHRLLGTRAAVETAISAIYPHTQVLEWFEYGGEPYHFRLTVRLSENGWDYGKHLQLIEKLQFYKNLRSHRDAIKYYLPLVTVRNPERALFESLLIHGRFIFNKQQLGLTQLFLKWAATQAITGSAGLVTRLHVENSERLCLRRLLLRGKLPFNGEQLGRARLLLALSAALNITAGAGLILRLNTEKNM